MTPNQSHVAGLELAKKAMEQQRERYGGVHKASLACLDGLIEIAKSAPAEPISREAVGWLCTHSDGRKRIELPGSVYDQDAGWGASRVPLYTAPPSPDAELVELLRESADYLRGLSLPAPLVKRIDAKLASREVKP